jgi:hypothetical protein
MYSPVRYAPYVCEVVPLPAREEYKSGKLKNKASRKIYGSQRKELHEKWKKLRKEELDGICSSRSF